MTPDYDDLNQALRRVDAVMGASEAHGCLCGMLAMDVAARSEPWVRVVLEDTDEADALVAECRGMLDGLYTQLRAQLHDPGLGFAPLVPSDRETVAERMAALAEWCEGFLYGLALGGMKAEAELSPDTAEILQDMANIAQSGFETKEDEENEQAYAEVLEYVRMGVLLINEELQPIKAPPRLQ